MGYLTVRGIQGHAAYPHLADNPAHRIVGLLDALTSKRLDTGSEHFQPSTLQITTIDVGNPTENVIPSEARATFNIRFCDLHTSESLKAHLHEILDAVGNGTDYSLDFRITGESFLTPPGPLSTAISDAVTAITGRTPELSTTGGTSDARFIKNFCPVAEFGLVGQTMHKVNENVSCNDVETLTEIYLQVLEIYFGLKQ